MEVYLLLEGSLHLLGIASTRILAPNAFGEMTHRPAPFARRRFSGIVIMLIFLLTHRLVPEYIMSVLILKF